MSYICLFANETGVSVAGDSRVTLQPGRLGLHFGGRKVFSDPQQNTVWCCCGLVTFGGIHYPSAAAQILRNPDRSLATALERIGGLVGPATKANSRLYRTDCSFHLLVGRVTDGKVDVRRLDALNGEVTIQRMDTPVLLEAGVAQAALPGGSPARPVRRRFARAAEPPGGAAGADGHRRRQGQARGG